MRKMLLPDVNVWLAMTFDAHAHHPAAKNWFDALTDETLYFCRMTQQGLLRLASNSKVFGNRTLSMGRAWQEYDRYRGDPRIAFADESPGVETLWRNFTQGSSFSPHVWNDAYLAAFAQAGGYEVVTFDKGFRRYTGISVTILP